MNATALLRSVIADYEVQETYEARMARLRREGKFLTARRLKRAFLAERVNPPTAGYGNSRER